MSLQSSQLPVRYSSSSRPTPTPSAPLIASSLLASSSSCLILGGLDPSAVSVLCSGERDGAPNGIGTLYTGHQFCSQPAVLAKGCVFVCVYSYFLSLIFDTFLLHPSLEVCGKQTFEGTRKLLGSPHTHRKKKLLIAELQFLISKVKPCGLNYL